MNASLAHHDPQLHELAMADAAARIGMISKDLFIEHDYSRYLNDALDVLMCEPRHGRMPCWLITGDAGMGKTAQLHRFARRYPDHQMRDNPTLLRPIVIVNLPPEPTRPLLEIAILEALNAPVITHNRTVDRASVIRRLLTAHETRAIIFDETQHICHSRSRDRAVVLDAIKALSTTCQVNVICAGTPAVAREFHADSQLERRFSITQFAQWKPGPELQRFLGTYERARPLRLPSRLADPDRVRQLLAEAGGITHRIIQCLNAAAIVAIYEGIERITAELITVLRTEPGRVLAARQRVGAELGIRSSAKGKPREGDSGAPRATAILEAQGEHTS
jgi:hypothetical protein